MHQTGSSARGRALHAWLWVCLLLAAAHAFAQSPAEVRQNEDAFKYVGRSAQFFVEPTATPLTFNEAERAFADGRFKPSTQDVPNFGHLSSPTWMRLAVHNPGVDGPFRIYLAQSWTGRMDAWLREPDSSLQTWTGGLRVAPGKDLRPGLGYAFDSVLPHGTSELFVRIKSNASATMELRVVPMPLTSTLEARANQLNGVVHGFLLALILTYALLWFALKDAAQGRYVVYVSAYLLMHLGYSGVGALMFWPDAPRVARFMTLAGMTLFAGTGIWFAREFFAARTWAPGFDQFLKWATRGVVAFMAIVIVLDLDRVALTFSFPFLAIFTLLEVSLGVLAVRRGRDLSGLFLTASLARLTGLVITSQAVVGRLPFNVYTFHAVEIGVLIEATIWAMALGLRLRRDRIDHVLAMRLAQSDPLTGLFNRRGFLNAAKPKIEQCQKDRAPIALIMADLDHFKAVNDVHGHEAGDAVLIEAAQRFKNAARSGDFVARWGGEEFLILMCGMSKETAVEFAERMRTVLSDAPILLPDKQFARLTTSVGVVVDEPAQHSIEVLLHQVDAALYSAKAAGRDRVVEVSDLINASAPLAR